MFLLDKLITQNNVKVPSNNPTFDGNAFKNISSGVLKGRKTGPDDLADLIPGDVNVDGVIMVLDENGIIKYITNKFVLNTFQMSMKEKFQLLESFGSANISFFGESAKVYSFGGMALDYASSDEKNVGKYFHQSSLIKMYNDILRGTQLVLKKRIAIMKIMNHLVYGYPINMSVGYSSAGDNVAQFQLQWVVTAHTLALPGVIEESDLEKMYSTALSTLKDEATRQFVSNTDAMIKQIDSVLEAYTDLELNLYNDYPENWPMIFNNEANKLIEMIQGNSIPDVSELLYKTKIDPYKGIDSSKCSADESAKNKVKAFIALICQLKSELTIFKSYRVL